MAFTYRISTEAEKDITKAYSWYEKEHPGLGDNFLESLDTAREAILKNPLAFAFRYKSKVRGYVMEKFPFIILFILNDLFIDVISVFHISKSAEVRKTCLTLTH